MIGKTTANYTIKHLIGSGGMADVYLGVNRLGKKAAIKVLKKKFSDEPTVHDRFMQEARIMVDLDHHNIRKVYDISEIEGQPAIIMEYLEGQTLKDHIERKKIKGNQLKKYFEQCKSALTYTHSKGIIHRDIKPSNIFITDHDEVKIVDFGIAKTLEGLSHTITGQTLGTIAYMSPEQVRDPKRVDSKTDVYSLGVTFFHVITGKIPYDISTDSAFTIQRMIVDEDLDVTILPEEWRGVIQKCLEKDVKERKSFSELFIGMKGYSGEETVISPTTPMISETPKLVFKLPQWPWYSLGGAVLVVFSIFLWPKIGEQQSSFPIKELESTLNPILTRLDQNMVRVKGGTFTMGCTSEQGEECAGDEKPAHKVILSGYYVSKYEVTQEEWRAVMGSDPVSLRFTGCDRCPVESVSMVDVQGFIKMLNKLSEKRYRLPTEAEWEYAARGGNESKGYKYSGSNDLSEVGYYYRNTIGKTYTVGWKMSNELGLYDMSGNVWEWCSDWYDETYYEVSSLRNPKGPTEGKYKVARGGSWSSFTADCRVSLRDYNYYQPSVWNDNLGFRLAKAL